MFTVDSAGRALQPDHFSLVLLSAICGALLQCRLYTYLRDVILGHRDTFILHIFSRLSTM
jgi:hypothetical protein